MILVLTLYCGLSRILQHMVKVDIDLIQEVAEANLAGRQEHYDGVL